MTRGAENPKSEIRNPKQIQSPKMEMLETLVPVQQ
jgi:hypothetical protein